VSVACSMAHCVAGCWILIYSPWHSSCSHQPWSGGTGPERPSWYRLWEAIIEKNSQRCSISKERARAEALLPSARLKPSHHALPRGQAVDIGVITAACSRALRQAEAYSSRVQVMLTMVSIDATGELNEELSESWSLAKKSLSWLAAKGGSAKSAGGPCERQVSTSKCKRPSKHVINFSLDQPGTSSVGLTRNGSIPSAVLAGRG
jgi:hypothetical protein